MSSSAVLVLLSLLLPSSSSECRYALLCVLLAVLLAGVSMTTSTSATTVLVTVYSGVPYPAPCAVAYANHSYYVSLCLVGTIVRYSVNGTSLPPTITMPGQTSCVDIAITADGRYLYAQGENGVMYRFFSNGTLDPAFTVSGPYSSIAVDYDGFVYACGSNSTISGRCIQYSALGSPIDEFLTNAYGYQAVVVYDGVVYALWNGFLSTYSTANLSSAIIHGRALGGVQEMEGQLIEGTWYGAASMAVDQSGYLWLVNQAMGAVGQFDVTTAPYGTLIQRANITSLTLLQPSIPFALLGGLNQWSVPLYSGITLNDDGNIVVANSYNLSLVIVNPTNGRTISTLTLPTSTFVTEPVWMAVDVQSNVWIGDNYVPQIVKFTPDLSTRLLTIYTPMLVYISTFTVDDNLNLYVSGSSLNGLTYLQFASNGSYIRQLQYPQGLSYLGPLGVTAGNIAVNTDNGDAYAVLNVNGVNGNASPVQFALYWWMQNGTFITTLITPALQLPTTTQSFVVVDSVAGTLLLFTTNVSAGVQVGAIVGIPIPPHPQMQPAPYSQLSVNVTAVLTLPPSVRGPFYTASTYPSGAGYGMRRPPSGFAQDSAGNWYIGDPASSQIVKLSPGGAVVEVFTTANASAFEPAAIGVNPQGTLLYSSNVVNNTVLVFTVVSQAASLSSSSLSSWSSSTTSSSSTASSSSSSPSLSNGSLCLLFYSLPGTVDFPWSTSLSMSVHFSPQLVSTPFGSAVSVLSGSGNRTFTNRFGATISGPFTIAAPGTTSSNNLLYLGSAYPLDGSGLTLNLSTPIQLPGLGPTELHSLISVSNLSGVIVEGLSARVDRLGSAYVSSVPGFTNVTIGAANINSLAANYDQCRAAITFTNGLRPPTQPSEINGSTRIAYSYSISDGVSYTVQGNLTITTASAFATLEDQLGNPYQQVVNVTGTRTYTYLATGQQMTSVISGLDNAADATGDQRFYPYSLLSAQAGVYSVNTAPFFDGDGLQLSLQPPAPINGGQPGVGALYNSTTLYIAATQQIAALTESHYTTLPLAQLQLQTYSFLQ